MHKIKEKFNKFRDLLTDSIWGYVFIFVFIGAFMYGAIILAQKYDSPDFKCPKEYVTKEEYRDDMDKWIDDELLINPEATEDELMTKRVQLFTQHNCEKGNWITGDELIDNANNPDGGKIMEVIKELESGEPQRINKNPTEEEIYNSEYIKHVRVALNAYLDGTMSDDDKFLSEMLDSGNECGLNAFDKSYYKSKFIVIGASDNDYKYQLRAFCEAGPTSEQRDKFDDFTKGMIKNSNYSL